MQPDYNELAKRQQQDYQSSRDPFQYGQQVAQRRYSEMMSSLDNQRQATQQSYGDLYSQARQRAVGGSAMGGPTLSGGMGQQQRDFVSAIEMQELSRIGQAREGASRDLFSQGQAAFSNAQLEGQQATQMQLGNQQAQLGLVQQKQLIMENKQLSDEQRAEQLAALGQGDTPVEKKEFLQYLGQGMFTAGVAGTTGITAVKVGLGVKAIAGAGGIGAATAANVSAATALAGGGISGGIATGLSLIPGWGWIALGAIAVVGAGVSYYNYTQQK